MPRYIGERRGEMYYRRDGKWHHCLDNGRCFNSVESARRDFNEVYREPPGYSFASLLFAFLIISLFMQFLGGILW